MNLHYKPSLFTFFTDSGKFLIAAKWAQHIQFFLIYFMLQLIYTIENGVVNYGSVFVEYMILF